MPDDPLVEIYRAGDIAAGSLLIHLLEERGVPAIPLDSGVDGFSRTYFGAVTCRIMALRSDVEAEAEEIAAAIREFEDTMGIAQRE